MTTIQEHFSLKSPRLVNPEKIYGKIIVEETINSSRLVGIEVELENHLLLRNPTPVWHVVSDGSLRNNGVEYITHPIPANWVPHALKDLLSNSLSPDCCFSPRTSVHVHVNCQDLISTQVVDVLLLYSCLEELFYQFTGRGRSKNIYCVPLYDTYLLSKITNVKLEQILQSWSKYTGLNVIPLAEKGTIEFRQMHGTFDYNKLTIWVRLITKLFDYCLSQGTANIRKLVWGFDKKTDLIGLMLEIFGDKDTKQFKNLSYETIKQGVMITKLAFCKKETEDNLFSTFSKTSPYFVGVK